VIPSSTTWRYDMSSEATKFELATNINITIGWQCGWSNISISFFDSVSWFEQCATLPPSQIFYHNI
jgi:hypothetical protein